MMSKEATLQVMEERNPQEYRRIVRGFEENQNNKQQQIEQSPVEEEKGFIDMESK